jgi:hypothetical protein
MKCFRIITKCGHINVEVFSKCFSSLHKMLFITSLFLLNDSPSYLAVLKGERFDLIFQFSELGRIMF